MAGTVREEQRIGVEAILPLAAAATSGAQAGRALRIWEAYGLVFLASGSGQLHVTDAGQPAR